VGDLTPTRQFNIITYYLQESQLVQEQQPLRPQLLVTERVRPQQLSQLSVVVVHLIVLQQPSMTCREVVTVFPSTETLLMTYPLRPNKPLRLIEQSLQLLELPQSQSSFNTLVSLAGAAGVGS